MFEITKPKQKPLVIVRAATASELSEYEKNKLASIEENAQENIIENFSITIGDNKQRIIPIEKEINLELGKLATLDSIKPSNISETATFVIKCELD